MIVLSGPDTGEHVKMKPGIKERWVAAQRSGDYKQGTGMLRMRNEYCCLGVLSDLAAKDGIVSWAAHPEMEMTHVIKDGDGLTHSAFLPTVVAKWAGVDPGDPYVDVGRDTRMCLTSMNDCGEYSFNDIADAIEAQL